MDCTTKLYRASTAQKVLGLKAITLRQWHLRKLYTPETEELVEAAEIQREFAGKANDQLAQTVAEIESAQRQGWRVYTFTDLLRLTVIRKLTAMDVSLERAGMIASRIQGSDALGGMPVPRVIEGEKVIQQGGKRERIPGIEDCFLVSFMPREQWVESAESLANDDERHRMLEYDVSMSTHTYTGREGIGSLAFAFKTEDRIPVHGRDVAIVLNVSDIARQVLAKLRELGEC
jgi:DNA-binding transcriptional MerR regulator